MESDLASATEKSRINPLDPLRIAIYRNFWLAGLFSNVGTWMHETGAVWLMTELHPSPNMVAAVRVAMMLPVFVLVLAAGVWADHFNRRTWLLGTQSLLLLIALTMWISTVLGWMSPWLLLSLTALLGIASTLNLPAWQAMTPELVPPAMIPSAVQAGSVSFNLARSIGPALAGLAIAQFGVGVTFLFNALSFLGTIAVLLLWRPQTQSETGRRKKIVFFDELKKGVFIVKNSVQIRSTLIRVLLFSFSASALWSLLSLLATENLGLRERGFGMNLASLGAGAVLAAGVLPWLRQVLSSEQLVKRCQIGFAALLLPLGWTEQVSVAILCLLLIGACWMTVMTTLNSTAQVYLPQKFRARGMSAFVMFFSLGMGSGAFMWGWIARWSEVGTAMWSAAAVMAAVALATDRLELGPLQLKDAVTEQRVD